MFDTEVLFFIVLNINKAKRFAKQQRSKVDIALASFYCYCLRAIKAVTSREQLQR